MDMRGFFTGFAEPVCSPAYLCFFMRNMSSEDIKRQIVEALASGKLQPTTIILGDNVKHKIENVEAGGIGIQIVEAREEKSQTMKLSAFPYFTQKCYDQKRVETVEAEIRAACKGSAETLWRVLWDNENLGYLETQHVDATKIYNEITKGFGKLPYTVRNFRAARNKR